MTNLLYKYLTIYKQVSLPGVGVFKIARQPAKHDIANKVIEPPALNIDFTAHPATGTNDFFEFLSKEKSIEEAAAINHFNDFAQHLNHEGNSGKSFELPGIGTLRKNANGEVSFEPAHVLAGYFPPAVAEPVVREKASYEILVGEAQRTSSQMREALHGEPETEHVSKDYWWIYAILLAVIGIAAIVYYYQRNGSLR